jgi:hypothetical protein
MDHFVTCVKYGEQINCNWKDIFEYDTEKQNYIGKFIYERHNIRKAILEKKRMAKPLTPAPTLQGTLSGLLYSAVWNK